MRNRAILAGMTTALLLVAFSVSFAQNPPAKPGPGDGERLANFLSLTPEQQTKLDEIRKARQEEAKAFREEMGKLRPQLREAMKDRRPTAENRRPDRPGQPGSGGPPEEHVPQPQGHGKSHDAGTARKAPER